MNWLAAVSGGFARVVATKAILFCRRTGFCWRMYLRSTTGVHHRTELDPTLSGTDREQATCQVFAGSVRARLTMAATVFLLKHARAELVGQIADWCAPIKYGGGGDPGDERRSRRRASGAEVDHLHTAIARLGRLRRGVTSSSSSPIPTAWSRRGSTP